MRNYDSILAMGLLGALSLSGAANAAAPWTEQAKMEKNAQEAQSQPRARRAARNSVAAGTLTDPVGDTLGAFTPKADATQLSATLSGGLLTIGMSFAGDITPCENGSGTVTPTQTPLGGFIDIDTDQDQTTGVQPFTDLLTSYNTGMGNEFYVDLCSYSSGDGAVDVVDDITDTVQGRAAIGFSARGFAVQIPLSLLGGDDGQADIAAVVGTLNEPTDAVPNGGSLAATAASTPAPGPTAAVNVPVLGVWGLGLLSLLAGVFGGWRLRRG